MIIYSIFNIILLLIILHFHKNVFNAIDKKINEENKDYVPPKHKSVANKFLEFNLLLRGSNPEIAEWITDMTQEERVRASENLKLLQDALDKKYGKIKK